MNSKKIGSIILGIMLLILLPLSSTQLFATQYTLQFDLNGGDMSSQSSKVVLEEQTVIDLTTIQSPTRAGYYFSGWKQGDSIVSGNFLMPAQNVTLVAKWEAAPQPIRFISGLRDTQQLPTDFTVATGGIVDIDAFAIPTHDRYQFAGWELHGKSINGEIAVLNNGFTFSARWSGSFELIRFDLQGGTATTLVPLEKTIGTIINIGDFEIPEKSGCDFAGWQLDNRNISGNFSVPEGGGTFVAQWNVLDSLATITANQTRITVEAEKTNEVLNYQTLFGLSATDTIKGDITDTITYEGKVERDKVDSYPIQAKVKNANNVLVYKMLIVEVVDTTAPQLTVQQTKAEKKVGIQEADGFNKIFGVTAADIVDGERVEITYQMQGQFDRYRPGRYHISISASDSSGNTVSETVELELLSLNLSGTVYLDTNYNSKGEEQIGLGGISLHLWDEDAQKIIETITSDDKGSYTFLTPKYKADEHASGHFKIEAEIPSHLIQAAHSPILEKQTSSFYLDSTKTGDIFLQGKDVEQLDLVLGKNLEITNPITAYKINKNEEGQLNLIVRNGKVSRVETDSRHLNINFSTGNIKVISDTKEKVKIVVYFEDRYQRLSMYKKEILIEIV